MVLVDCNIREEENRPKVIRCRARGTDKGWADGCPFLFSFSVSFVEDCALESEVYNWLLGAAAVSVGHFWVGEGRGGECARSGWWSLFGHRSAPAETEVTGQYG